MREEILRRRQVTRYSNKNKFTINVEKKIKETVLKKSESTTKSEKNFKCKVRIKNLPKGKDENLKRKIWGSQKLKELNEWSCEKIREWESDRGLKKWEKEKEKTRIEYVTRYSKSLKGNTINWRSERV